MRADLIERLRHRADDDEPDFTDADVAIMREAADALASQEPVAWRWRFPDRVWNYQEGRQAINGAEHQPLFAAPVVPVAAKAEAEGWPEIAEHFRRGMLDAEDILNRVHLEAAPAIDLKAVAMSRASDRLRQARHDMIYKYGPGYLNAAPTGKGDGQ